MSAPLRQRSPADQPALRPDFWDGYSVNVKRKRRRAGSLMIAIGEGRSHDNQAGIMAALCALTCREVAFALIAMSLAGTVVAANLRKLFHIRLNYFPRLKSGAEAVLKDHSHLR
jgi:hypothetical protein